MMAESIVSLSAVLVTSLLDARKRHRTPNKRNSETEQALLSADERGDGEGSRATGNTTPADDDDGLGLREVAMGLVVSSVLCVILVSVIFGQDGIRWWATVLALVLACVFSLLGCVCYPILLASTLNLILSFRVRALGQTDLNP
jgi:hypothetical protein